MLNINSVAGHRVGSELLMTAVLGRLPPIAIDGYPIIKSLIPPKHLLYLRIAHAVEVVGDFNLSGHEPQPTG